ncbi:hypothetical protein N7490_007625 [Penicillium lividum]|nr:hypothetical protein N7490_007625 [Penicillium lividum]
MVLRFLSRHLRRSKIWWDDAFCIAAMLHTYGMLAMQYHYARVGMRHHVTDLPTANTILMVKMLIIDQIVYYNAMVLVKFSYLFFYLRIFVTREFRILTWICMGCAASYWTGSMLQIFLICIPFEKNWDVTVPGHCASQNVAFSTIGAFNLITDVMIMALPIRFIWKLQMSIGTKMALYGIFGLGIFVTEPALAISNACAPMLRPILKAACLALFASAKAGYSTQPASGPKPILSKDNTFDRIHDVDIEYPLTELDQRSASDEGSLNDRSHDSRSQDGPRQFPRSVVGEHKRH